MHDKTFNTYKHLLEMDANDNKNRKIQFPTTAKMVLGQLPTETQSSLLTPASPAEAMYLYSATPTPSFYPASSGTFNDGVLGLYGLDLSNTNYGGLLGVNYFGGR